MKDANEDLDQGGGTPVPPFDPAAPVTPIVIPKKKIDWFPIALLVIVAIAVVIAW